MCARTHFAPPEVIVALQGTLDTFALPDVLRLLAATKKSGQLNISGSRGAGSAWVSGGDVTSVVVDHAPLAVEPVDALFELLRFEDGSFTFDAEAAPPEGQHLDVEPLIESAQALLEEWREIEAVVPSLTSWVTLRPRLRDEAVTIDQERWATLVAVGSGATVGAIGEALALAELPVSRAVGALVELGAVEVDARAPEPVQPVTAAPKPATEQAPRSLPPLAHAADPEDRADDDDAPIPGPRARRARPKRLESAGTGGPEVFVPMDLSALQQQGSYDKPEEMDSGEDATEADLAAAFPGLTSVPESGPEAAPSDEVEGAGPGAEPEAEAAPHGDDGEPLNRGMLLKFLSSVKS